MPLPILNTRHEHSHADLIRLFLKTENLWAEHMASAEALDVGTAYTNGELSEIWDANTIRDVAVPEELSAQDAFEQVEAHYASKGTRCFYWTFNPSAPAQRTQPLMELLLSRGHQAFSNDVMALHQAPLRAVGEMAGVKIIPARASFRHTRQILEESAERYTPQLADANMLHLDDPHWDALLALKDGEPVAYMGVLAAGEIGRIDDVYVAKAHRRQGLGALMLSRVLEISARSLFRHVLLSVNPKNQAAIGLYEKFGFAKVGEIVGYFRPGLEHEPG
jgi:ribosomal protein S18 acetylase RimI-like enzyme